MTEEHGTLVILATLTRFTEGARRVVMGGDRAMAVVQVDGYDDGGQVGQFIWNGAAGRLVGHELGVKTVFDPTAKTDEEEMGKRVVLTWNDTVIKMRKNIPGAS